MGYLFTEPRPSLPWRVLSRDRNQRFEHFPQRIDMLATAHDLHDLAVNQPCRSDVRTKMTHECQRGNRSLGLADQIGGNIQSG